MKMLLSLSGPHRSALMSWSRTIIGWCGRPGNNRPFGEHSAERGSLAERGMDWDEDERMRGVTWIDGQVSRVDVKFLQGVLALRECPTLTA